MSGFIFSVSEDSWESFCNNSLTNGYFTPYAIPVTEDDMSPRKRKSRNKVLAATFGDFISMRPGDNVYFLSNRKIYGIGRTVQIGSDCKYDNYLNASALLPDCRITPTHYLTTQDTRARWVFFFQPSPFFFKKGVDMDDVLRYRPQAFKVLRAFEGLSFIKIDDEENRALREFISLVNKPSHDDINENTFSFSSNLQSRLLAEDLTAFTMDIGNALSNAENREYVLSEMLIEGALLQGLSAGTTTAMGPWDYLTHQLIASPFKPLQYIDKIDVFGYRFSQHYQDEPKLITKYLLVEMKKDVINRAALEQTMQYVDWICNEYASGDYSKIEAFVVGDRAARNIDESIEDICQRSYIAETHPAKPEKWNNIKIVQYFIEENAVRFEIHEI